ncbi:hypothetical protein BJ138DRAFT_1146676 [Hygrophoropsis aurantiaca]|uniref:Uncharacterized protein n=1 Tax=Hygrophoropsis aurantiaca TaxID=72124 RepID=A0ACB8AIR7_9AGAM|nr:hypothetical protein BJ138DRAFT_1146676 [Hygrophoropsis aurantiaca]
MDARALLGQAFNDFIFNDIPLHLIHLLTMNLVDRIFVRQHFKPVIDNITDNELKPARVETSLRKMKDKLTALVKTKVKYAILSHRWFDVGEPTYQEFVGGTNVVGSGADKLVMFCQKAKEYGCEFAWSDTCCIDKTSSSELDESIRSMFRWYRESYICIAYLGETISLEGLEGDAWFTRGWTLQELLAPSQIKFYKKDWTPLTSVPNDKEDNPRSIMFPISRITNISIMDLCYFTPGMWGYSMRERLSWASHRKTTRVEDMAYCLIGIFDINLTVAYGEGRRAFLRLQQAIIENNDSWEIFAWEGEPSPYNSAIASGPECYPKFFIDGKGIIALAWYGDLDTSNKQYSAGDKLFAMTNHGLRIKVLFRKVWRVERDPEVETRYTLSMSSLEDIVVDVTVDVMGMELDLALSSTYRWGRPCAGLAIGILDYEVGGEVDTSRSYTAFLLHHPNDKLDLYEKVPTKKVVKVKVDDMAQAMTAQKLRETRSSERLTEDEAATYMQGIEELEKEPLEIYIH